MNSSSHPYSRRQFLATGTSIVAGAGAAALLAGCSNSRAVTGSSSSFASSSAALTPATLTPAAASPAVPDISGQFSSAKIDWKQFAGTTITVSAEQHPWYTAISPLLGQFTELTGIKVTPSVLGEDQYVSKIAVQLSGGSSTPDIFMVNQFGQATGSGWLEQLDSYLTNTKLTDPAWYAKDDFFPGALSFAKSGGKTMAMPITAEAQMLFLRSDVVKAPPATLDDLVTAAVAANKGGVAGFGSRAVASANQTPWPFGGFAFTEGGFFIDPSGKAVFDSEANVTALQLYAKLLRETGPKGVSSWGFLENEQAMQQGRLAMWVDSSTFLGDLKDASKSKVAMSIDAYPFPAKNGKSVPNVWYWVVGINSKSAHKDAAWMFLQWSTSKPVSQAAGLVGASPARASSWQTADASAKIGKDNADRILKALQNADSQPMALAWQNTKWSQASDGLARAINSAVTGADAKQALNAAQTQAASIIG